MVSGVRLSLIIAIFSWSTGAAADERMFNSYGGIQLIEATFSGDDFDDVSPTGVVARVGLLVTERLSAELRVTFRLADDSVDVAGVDSDVEIDHLRGVYAVYHLSPDIGNSFYAVLGYTEAEIDTGANGATDDLDERGPSIGAGLNFGQFNLELMQYFAEDDYDASVVALGYTLQF